MPKVTVMNITIERFAYYLFDLNVLNNLIFKTQTKLSRMYKAWGENKQKMKDDVLNQVTDLENILIFLNNYKKTNFKNL